MVAPGRKYSAGSGYRYGFNGKENDKEVAGDGNEYNYGFRIYNSRIGKFLSVDPLFKGFPWNSTYSYAEGDVIRSIDLDGTEKTIITGTYWRESGGTLVNNLQTTTLPQPGPLGSGTLYNVTIDLRYWDSKGAQGDQFEYHAYIPAVEPPPSFLQKVGKKIGDFFKDGGSDGQSSSGGGSSQPYGLIIQSSEGGFGTTTGKGDQAKYFDVTDTGILGLLGGAGGGGAEISADQGKGLFNIIKKIEETVALGKQTPEALKKLDEVTSKMLEIKQKNANKNKVRMCSECKVKWEYNEKKGAWEVSDKKATDTVNLETPIK